MNIIQDAQIFSPSWPSPTGIRGNKEEDQNDLY